ncbi:DHA2 family efflux MFS transporter permease subunit [Cohnella endophytica]|uniref:DHA2 family efflux MFS transporter permease subunit n=1 Tax=Cohnella endophytica TaxID=2419778 RepID=A0A494XW62_9BACL|nr:MDR family MFS transporter [Cohnella endophytica]RKP53206.1 DHA2 family efflux MFS transporter permease subunit [Cohnella endophytica]
MELELQSPNKSNENKVLLIGIFIAIFFASIDETVTDTAVARIVGDLGGLSLMPWITSAFMLASLCVMPTVGKLCDRFGRRTVYVSGLFIFMVGSAFCGLSNDMTQLILFRALQGFGAGIMVPMALIVIGDMYTAEKRAKMQSMIYALYGVTAVLGPLVGGWIIVVSSWRWVFYINLPFGLLSILLISLKYKNHKSESKEKIDLGGIFTLAGGTTSLMLGLTFGGSIYAWISWQIGSILLLSVVCFGLFIRIELKTKQPIIPLHLFKNKNFLVINGISFMLAACIFGALIFVPFYLQGVLDYSPAASGLIMLAIVWSMTVAGIVGGKWVFHIGVRTQMIIGAVLMGIGFYLLSILDLNTSIPAMIASLSITGIGIGLIMPLIMLALYEVFSKDEITTIVSSSQYFRQIGGTLGATILGALLNMRSSIILKDQLLPHVNQLSEPNQELVNQVKGMIDNNPQQLLSPLFNADVANVFPISMRDEINPVLTSTLSSSLHAVFIGGLVLACITLALAFIVGNIRIAKKSEEASISNAAEDQTNEPNASYSV